MQPLGCKLGLLRLQPSLPTSPEGTVGMQTDDSRLPNGITVLQAESAKEYELKKSQELQQVLAGMRDFQDRDVFKKDRRNISKLIKLEITQVSGNKQQVRFALIVQVAVDHNSMVAMDHLVGCAIDIDKVMS